MVGLTRTGSGGQAHTPALSGGAIALVTLMGALGAALGPATGWESGAMLPGLLGAVTGCVVSGRKDWRRRVAFFAFFAALAWSLGGSLPLGPADGLLASGRASDIAAGLAWLYLLGVIWGGIGGAGTVWAAVAERDQLADLVTPTVLILAAWALLTALAALAAAPDPLVDRLLGVELGEVLRGARPERWNWLGSAWIAALAAGGVSTVLVLFRRSGRPLAMGCLYLAAGWWLGFSILAVACGLRAPQPLTANWAGLVGLAAALVAWLVRQGLGAAVWAGAIVGLMTGSALVLSALIEPIGRASCGPLEWQLWRQMLVGAFAGLGQALVLGYLSTRAPRMNDAPPARRTSESLALALVLIGVTFLNVRDAAATAWVPRQLVPSSVGGWPFTMVLTAAYAVLATSLTVVLVARRRGRWLPAIPTDWLGKGQLLALLLVWWLVAIHGSASFPLEPAGIPGEAAVFFGACLATVLVMIVPREEQLLPEQPAPDYERLAQKSGVAILAVGVLLVVIATVVLRAVHVEPAEVRLQLPARAAELARVGCNG